MGNFPDRHGFARCRSNCVRSYWHVREQLMTMQSPPDRPTTGPTESNGHERVDGAPESLGSQSAGSGPPPREEPPLRSVHTSNFSAMLQELGISILVTTYQAGKLVMLRPDGDRLNTHFRR